MKYFIYILILLFAFSCKEKYESPVDSPVTGYLVVEGIVNNGSGNTTIRLTRTTKLGDRTIIFEKGAVVKVEGENNISFSLIEQTAGNYSINNLNLPANQKYRLRIKTTGGKEFLSDFAEVKKNPPIDSISWQRNNEGLQLFIHTHDDQNNTRYYQWDYVETWEFHSSYYKTLKYKYTPSTDPRDKNPKVEAVYWDSISHSSDASIRTCWQSNSSTNLILGSTAKLEKDVVYLPLTEIPTASWKLSVLYSIFVKQYSLTKEGYEYLEKMRKNTEITGSVFDAQPSQLKGNIHDLANPNDPVIGFFSICNVEQKRLWIANSEVPNWRYFPPCEELSIPNNSDSIRGTLNMLPTTPEFLSNSGSILRLIVATPECVDCTLRGTNVKPTFWP